MTTDGKSVFFTRFATELIRVKQERGTVEGYDIGCGKGDQARQMTDERIGALVIGVDKQMPLPQAARGLTGNPGWIRSDIIDWMLTLQHDEFDFVFARNLLHFLEDQVVYEELLPRIRRCIRPGGVVGISAFYRWPQPDIPAKIISYHGLDRLMSAFPNWEIVYENDRPMDGPAMYQPGTHRWYSSRLIIRQPN